MNPLMLKLSTRNFAFARNLNFVIVLLNDNFVIIFFRQTVKYHTFTWIHVWILKESIWVQSNTAPLFVALHIVFGVCSAIFFTSSKTQFDQMIHLIKLSFRGIITKSGMFCQMDFPCTGISVISREKRQQM